jgi:hypothetical protein
LIAAGYKQLKLKKSPTVEELLAGIVALLSIFSGITIGIIFILTKPPAIEELSGDSLGFIGLITLVFCVGVGVRDIVKTFFK